jgi:hypothetical protein
VSLLPKNLGTDKNVLKAIEKTFDTNPEQAFRDVIDYLERLLDRFEFIYKILYDQVENASGSVEGAPTLIDPNWRFNISGNDCILQAKVSGTWTEVAKWSRA